jgi:hypothetical protein
VIDAQTQQILSTAFTNGKCHDFDLFKRSEPMLKLDPKTMLLCDLGYVGIKQFHACCILPHKRTKLQPLSDVQKLENRERASRRITVEHVFRRIKIFKILSEKYRNRRQRFELRFNLVAAVCNFERTLLT